MRTSKEWTYSWIVRSPSTAYRRLDVVFLSRRFKRRMAFLR